MEVYRFGPVQLSKLCFSLYFAMTGLHAILMVIIDLSIWSTPVALLIATTKALVVVVIFMEMCFGQPLTWLAGASGIGFMILLIALTIADVFSRGWLS